MVQGYGYKNVKEFLAEYRASKAEHTDYQSAVAKWEQQTGNKAEPDSLKAKLQRKTQEVKEQENNRQNNIIQLRVLFLQRIREIQHHFSLWLLVQRLTKLKQIRLC